MPIRLPPPPKNRSAIGLIVLLAFVGWTVFLLMTYVDKKPLPQSSKRATYIEVELDGPRPELDRYQAVQKSHQTNR